MKVAVYKLKDSFLLQFGNKKIISEGFIVKFSNFYLCNEAIKHLQDLKTLHKNTMKFSKTILKLDDKL